MLEVSEFFGFVFCSVQHADDDGAVMLTDVLGKELVVNNVVKRGA